MHKADIVFFLDVRERADKRHGLLGKVLLGPFNRLLRIRVEPGAGFVPDRHAVVVPDQAHIHVLFNQIDALIGIDAISHNITKAYSPFHAIFAHGLEHSLESGGIGMDI